MENEYRVAVGRMSEQRLRRLFGGNENRGETSQRSCFGESLAMLYSPYQNWQNLNDLEEGFCAGTIFKELDKPFLGGCRNGGVFNG